MKLIDKLAKIQKELKAGKDQHNDFSNFNYRSAEGILEAVKPLLDGMVLTLSDKMVEVGGRVYVEATANLIDGEHELNITAYAREAMTKKGMDEAQITGAASSYARKYALNGMFSIDDNKDPDTQDNSNHTSINEVDQQWIDVINAGNGSLEDITDPRYKKHIEDLMK